MNKYEIVNHGVEHAQYFQGCGTCGTPFKQVVTGCGMNAVAAYLDAREQVYVNDDNAERFNLPLHPRGINAKDKVPMKYQYDKESEMYYYVSIRYEREDCLMTAWTVYLPNEFDIDIEIDTVYFDSDMTEREVKESLINHDGYEPNIRIEKDGE